MENILIIGFNRPDCVRKLIKPLLLAKPAKLFIALDGPRYGMEDDKEKCMVIRNLIESANWNCDVKCLFGKRNQGCNNHVVKAIDWFFDNVDEGIMLEDDCIPDPSFILFAHELLWRYRKDDRIFMISGMSLTPSQVSNYDYRFSRLVNIWGWATWKRAWKKLVNDLSQWPQLRKQRIMACYGTEEVSQMKLMDAYYYGNRELTWGIKWRLTCLANNAYSIAPTKNLVQNIGFNRNDSHSKTFYHPITDINASRVQFPIRHPEDVVADIKLDELGLRYYYEHESKNQ